MPADYTWAVLTRPLLLDTASATRSNIDIGPLQNKNVTGNIKSFERRQTLCNPSVLSLLAVVRFSSIDA